MYIRDSNMRLNNWFMMSCHSFHDKGRSVHASLPNMMCRGSMCHNFLRVVASDRMKFRLVEFIFLMMNGAPFVTSLTPSHMLVSAICIIFMSLGPVVSRHAGAVGVSSISVRHVLMESTMTG